jgi:hypothetical protein
LLTLNFLSVSPPEGLYIVCTAVEAMSQLHEKKILPYKLIYLTSVTVLTLQSPAHRSHCQSHSKPAAGCSVFRSESTGIWAVYKHAGSMPLPCKSSKGGNSLLSCLSGGYALLFCLCCLTLGFVCWLHHPCSSPWNTTSVSRQSGVKLRGLICAAGTLD